MIPFKFNLYGEAELGNAFAQLPKAVAKNVMTRILLKAGVPIAVTASRLAPRNPRRTRGPSLSSSIAVSTKLSRRQRRRQLKKDGAIVFIGPRVPHAFLIEIGTGPRWQKTTQRYTGHTPAHPFMRPAWESEKNRALTIIREEIWIELSRAARRLRKRAEAYKAKLKGA